MKLKRFSFVFSISAVLLASAGCTSFKDEVKPLPKKEVTTKIPEDSVVTSEDSAISTPNTEEVSSDYGKPIELQKTDKKISLGKVHTYDLSVFFKGQRALIAPGHIYQDQILYYNNNEKKSDIYSYTMNNKANQKIYSTNDFTSMMTGVGQFLFWVETKQPTEHGLEWSIFKMDVTTKKIKKIESGESRFDTAPPHIEGTSDHATWIVHEATEKKTISTIKSYSIKTSQLKTLKSFTLKEGEKRDGIYPFDYRDSDAGLIIHKSSFKKGIKHPTLETIDGSYKKNMNGLIDFSRGKNYVALGTEGDAIFQLIGSKEEGLNYSAADTRTTVDAFHFLSDTQVIFREGMNQLFYADLKKKTVSPLTDYKEMLSKPVYANGYVVYSDVDLENIKFKVVTPHLK